MPITIDSLTSEGIADIKGLRTQAAVQAVSASTLALTASSELVHVFTGNIAGQVVSLPDATTIQVGHRVEIWNLSFQPITIQNASGTVLQNLSANYYLLAVLQVSGGTAGIWNIFYQPIGDAAQSAQSGLLDDFLNATTSGQAGWTSSLAGGGGTIISSQSLLEAGHPGTIRLSIGANGARASLNLGDLLLGGGTCVFETAVKIGTLAVSGGDDYLSQYGIGDNYTVNGTDPLNGVFFEYNRSSSLSWRTRTGSSNTFQNTITSVTVQASTWYKLRAVINSASTQVLFYIGTGNTTPTLVATHTLNIPTSAIDPFLKMRKTNGGGLVSSDIDYYLLNYSFASIR